jgi:ribulose-5-phosphate 4-epimerase/fuculose-1-phosphate aldolase
MGYSDTQFSADIDALTAQVKKDAQHAFQVLRDTHTTTAFGTVGFVVRVPGQEKLLVVNDPGPWRRGEEITPALVGFDGTVLSGKSNGQPNRYTKLFQAHADINIISHVHTPYVAAWAQAHRSFPITYVAFQRHHLLKEVPVYIDRRQPEVDFIIEHVNKDPNNTAIVEANGGGTVWGKGGVRELTDTIILLEEAAQLQWLALAVGGSRNYGAGVLKQNWKMTGIYEQGKALGLLPTTDL